MMRAFLSFSFLCVIASSAWGQPANQAPSGAPIATTTIPGLVKPDGTSITVDGSGLIHSPGGGVTSFNSRTGAISLSSADVIAALTYTPPSISGTPTAGHSVVWTSATQLGDGGAPPGYNFTTATTFTGTYNFSTTGNTAGAGTLTIPDTADITADLVPFPTSYLANVATRMEVPDGYSPSTHMMARTIFYARQKITSLQIVIPNFYVTQNVSGEAGVGAASTVTASIEYPAGTCTPVTFSSLSSGTVPNDGYLVSDVLNITIPDGAEAWARKYVVNTSGVVISAGSATQNGDAVQYANSGVSDQTVSCTAVTNTTNPANRAPPLAILAQSTRSSACLFGDSRVFGLQDYPTDATYDTGNLTRFIGPSTPYIKMGVPTDSLYKTLTNVANRTAIAAWCSFAVDEYGINDILNNGQTAAQTIARRTTAATTIFAGIPVYGTTLEPKTTSTDSWTTLINQTVSSSESVRLSFNASVIAGISGEVNYIDLSGAIDPNSTGFWPIFCGTVSSNNSSTCTSGTASTPDGTHEAPNGAVLVKRSNVWNGYIFQRR